MSRTAAAELEAARDRGLRSRAVVLLGAGFGAAVVALLHCYFLDFGLKLVF